MHLYQFAVLLRIVTGVQPPWGELADVALPFGEGVRVLLQDTDAVPPVLDTEIITNASPGARGPWASGKGAGATFFHPR